METEQIISTPITIPPLPKQRLNFLSFLLLERQNNNKSVVLMTLDGLQVWCLSNSLPKSKTKRCIVCKDLVQMKQVFHKVLSVDHRSSKDAICKDCIDRMVAVYPNKMMTISRKTTNGKRHYIYAN